MKLDIRGALVAIPVRTLMRTTKAILWMLKIFWMVPTLQVVEPHYVTIHRCPQFTDTFALCSYWIVSNEHSPSPVCVSITKCSFECSLLSGNLKCLPRRRPMFTVANHGLQPVNLWVTVTLQSCHFDILIILDFQLSPHLHPV